MWLVIDIEERPDLFARCHKAHIRAFLCPRCQDFTFEFFPLALYYPSVDRIVFIFDRRQSQEQTQAIAEALALWVATGVKPKAAESELTKMTLHYLQSALVLDELEFMLRGVPQR